MGVKKVAKKGVTSGFRVRSWLGTEAISQNKSILKYFFNKVFSKDKEVLKDKSFEQCLQHYHMSEDDLGRRMKQSKQMILGCLGGGLLVFVYMFFQFAASEILGGLVCFMLTILLLSYALREHFNLYQMKQRRLGCTIKEWLQSLVKRG